MIALSAAALVATCTPTFGLHSSSSETSSYVYLAFASSLRRRTASSTELRPPRPLAATPPVNGPMKAILTVSFALAAEVPSNKAAAQKEVSAQRRVVCEWVMVYSRSDGMARYSCRKGGVRISKRAAIRTVAGD